MANVKIIDQYKVEFSKNWWKDIEINIAVCLGLQIEDRRIIADTRIICAESLWGFMKHCTPDLLNSSMYTAQKQGLFKHLKVAYEKTKKDFNDIFASRLDYPKPLYKHQTDSLAQMIHRKYNLLSFEQGLGKTITSATLSRVLDVPRTIIVCPSIVKWNWYHDMVDDWGFDPLNWTILDRRKKHSLYAFRERFVVINFEMVEKFMDYLCRDKVGHIIIDECHYIKKHTTKTRYKPIAKLVKHHKEARISLLSGTPITNRIDDFFSYLKLTGHPLGRSIQVFRERYTISDRSFGHNKVVGSKNLADLRLRISNFMIRKKTEECLDLPDLLINKYYFKFDEFQEEYQKTMEELYDKKKKWETSSKQEKAQAKIDMDANIHTLNRIVATSKANNIKTLIDSLWEKGEKVIVFAGYKDALGALEQMYGDRCVKIDGSVPSHTRQSLIEKFKNDPECHVFLGNFKAAGVGINLVNSSNVIFMNFPFTPDDLEQPYKRAHRIGQTKNVNVYYTIAEDTIDEHLFGLVMDKTKDINSLIDDGKDGVIHYDKIKNKLFHSLISDYEKKNKILPTKNLITL